MRKVDDVAKMPVLIGTKRITLRMIDVGLTIILGHCILRKWNTMFPYFLQMYYATQISAVYVKQPKFPKCFDVYNTTQLCLMSVMCARFSFYKNTVYKNISLGFGQKVRISKEHAEPYI